MTTSLFPQEVYLLERYSSNEYFALMRDAWEAMVRHADDCLEQFTSKLPADYRSRALPDQPDIVWGQRVIPNFRDTLQDLYESYISLSHGHVNSLNTAHRVANDFRGQLEFSSEWFDELEPKQGDKHSELLLIAVGYAGNIWRTAGAYWIKGALTVRYDPASRGPINGPSTWPKYQLNHLVTIRTGEPVPQTGVYLPLIDDSCAQLLIAGDAADEASVGYDEHTMQNISSEPTNWTLVERVPDETVKDGLLDLLSGQTARVNRVPAGDPCPRSGWWYSPAQVSSRRKFKHGDIFPDFEGNHYGATFWLWSQDQADL